MVIFQLFITKEEIELDDKKMGEGKIIYGIKRSKKVKILYPNKGSLKIKKAKQKIVRFATNFIFIFHALTGNDKIVCFIFV